MTVETPVISGRTHHDACAIANRFAMAMRHRITAAELAAGDAGDPTYSSDVKWLL